MGSVLIAQLVTSKWISVVVSIYTVVRDDVENFEKKTIYNLMTMSFSGAGKIRCQIAYRK